MADVFGSGDAAGVSSVLARGSVGSSGRLSGGSRLGVRLAFPLNGSMAGDELGTGDVEGLSEVVAISSVDRVAIAEVTGTSDSSAESYIDRNGVAIVLGESATAAESRVERISAAASDGASTAIAQGSAERATVAVAESSGAVNALVSVERSGQALIEGLSQGLGVGFVTTIFNGEYSTRDGFASGMVIRSPSDRAPKSPSAGQVASSSVPRIVYAKAGSNPKPR